MAATCIDNDYVHILKRRILDIRPHASFGIIQVADFERSFEVFDIQKEYRRGIEFGADIIIMFFGANVRKDSLREEVIILSSRNIKKILFDFIHQYIFLKIKEISKKIQVTKFLSGIII